MRVRLLTISCLMKSALGGVMYVCVFVCNNGVGAMEGQDGMLIGQPSTLIYPSDIFA